MQSRLPDACCLFVSRGVAEHSERRGAKGERERRPPSTSIDRSALALSCLKAPLRALLERARSGSSIWLSLLALERFKEVVEPLVVEPLLRGRSRKGERARALEKLVERERAGAVPPRDPLFSSSLTSVSFRPFHTASPRFA